MLEVPPPLFDKVKRQHCFELNGAPCLRQAPFQVGEAYAPFKPGTGAEQIYQDFCQAFLGRAANYFSAELPLTTFLKRLVFSWDLGELEEDIQVKAPKRLELVWIPARILFQTGRYELVWQLVGVEEFSGLDEEELPAFASSGGGEGLPVSLEEVVETTSIPFESAGRSLTPRGAARKKVREARLRVAVAQLRAERLAQNYFEKYGDFEGVGEDSDSDLSLDSDPEITAALLRKNIG
jgi:hypothetical protein